MGRAPEPFHCARPPAEHPKVIRSLCSSELLEADVQLVDEEGANEPHHHAGQDGLFVVLDGAVRFHGSHEVIAELGERDGILVPPGVDYCFEQAGDGPAEALHVAAVSDAREDRRVGESSGSPKVE